MLWQLNILYFGTVLESLIPNTGDIIIKGGTVKATGAGGAEGILVNGDIVISGGTVEAYGGEGGGKGLEGNITISGGTVTAVGGDGDSEGSGYGGAGVDGALEVNGGTLTATGGAKAEGGADGLGISEDSTITLGTNVKMYQGDAPDPTTEAAPPCSKRYVIIK